MGGPRLGLWPSRLVNGVTEELGVLDKLLLQALDPCLRAGDLLRARGQLAQNLDGAVDAFGPDVPLLSVLT